MKTVLFIGTHNVIRSKYAEAYFNYMVNKNRVPGGGRLSDEYVAISKGTYIGQGRLPRFKALWNNAINSKYHTPHANKLRFNDFIDADFVIGMYEEEIRPQLFYKTTPNVMRKVKGTWSANQAIDVEYWRVPNLLGTGDCQDGCELDDPREIISNIEFNVEMLIDRIDTLVS